MVEVLLLRPEVDHDLVHLVYDRAEERRRGEEQEDTEHLAIRREA